MSEPSSAPMPEIAANAKPAKSETKDFMQFLVKLAVFVFILRSFIFAPFNIPSESMLPRLMIGDYLIVSKWSYGYSRYSLPFGIPLIPGRIFASTPDRGDVVVFKAPPNNDVDYIKRVIGLPGDLIEVKAGQVFLNGTAIPKKRVADFIEPLTENSACKKEDAAQFRETSADGTVHCRYPRFKETLPGGRSYYVLDIRDNQSPTQNGVNPDYTEVYAVPDGHLFLMGDNRDNSSDSRFPAEAGGGIGLVPQENLVGKARFTVFSTDGTSEWVLPWTWFSAARWNRIGEGF